MIKDEQGVGSERDLWGQIPAHRYYAIDTGGPTISSDQCDEEFCRHLCHSRVISFKYLIDVGESKSCVRQVMQRDKRGCGAKCFFCGEGWRFELVDNPLGDSSAPRERDPKRLDHLACVV